MAEVEDAMTRAEVIEDYQDDKYGPICLTERTTSFVFPGELLADSGAHFLVGYNATAPVDAHGDIRDWTARLAAAVLPPAPEMHATWVSVNIDQETTLHLGILTKAHKGPANACGIDAVAGEYIYFDVRSQTIRKVVKSEW